MATLWPDTVHTADKVPETPEETDARGGRYAFGSLHGLHALLPHTTNAAFLTHPAHSPNPIRLFAVGAVDVSGKVIEHEDGVVRAESMKLLALRLVDMVRGTVYLPPADRTMSPKQVYTYGAPCGHDAYHVISNFPSYSWGGGGQGAALPEWVWVFRRECGAKNGMGDYGCKGWERVRAQTSKIELTIPTRELEQLLLQRYEVPRLPEDSGPWFPVPSKLVLPS
jgi:hypothetical protein